MARSAILSFTKVGPESYIAWRRRHMFAVQRNSPSAPWLVVHNERVVGRFSKLEAALGAAHVYAAGAT